MSKVKIEISGIKNYRFVVASALMTQTFFV